MVDTDGRTASGLVTGETATCHQSDGRTASGLVTGETATSVTLGRDKGESETILKQNIDEIKSTGKSLMPEGLEKTIDPQAMADLLAFLKQVQYDIGTLPDFAQPEKQ